MKIFILLLIAATTANGIHLDCLYSQWTYGNILINSVPTCHVAGVDASGNSTHILSTNLTSTQISRIGAIDFGTYPANCAELGITSIPRGASLIFPNLTALAFQNCPIQTINSDELNEYENLEIFHVASHGLTQIPGNLFSDNQNLRYAGFTNGQIRNVGEGILDNLPNLEIADFRGNTCINQRAYNVSQLPNLIENLRLNCPATSPETTTVSPMEGIEIGCRFSYRYNEHLFLDGHYTCIVVYMNIFGNSNRVVRANGTSADLAAVRHLDFGSWDWNCPDLNLNFFPQGLLDVFPGLTHISLDECAITFLNSDDLREYSTLQVIDFSWMFVPRIPGDFFTHTPNLIYAGFRYSQVAHVGENLLDNLQSLQRADFRYNDCINIFAYNTSQLPNLIEGLKQNCPDDPDVIITTTVRPTTTSTTTTTSSPPTCQIGNIETFVCDLEEEVQFLHHQVATLSDENRNLQASNEDLQALVGEMRVQLDDHEARLAMLEGVILELQQRQVDFKIIEKD